MLTPGGTRRLAEWIEECITPEQLRRLIPENHPVRWWHPRLGEPGSAETLVNVLAQGGHLTLLAALILIGRSHARAAPPPEAETELAEALVSLDAEIVKAGARNHAAKPDDVFLCYAHEDVGPVDIICSVLRTHGLSVFRDNQSIPPGSGIAASIVSSVNQARAAVVVVSAASNASGWVRRESEQVMARRSAASMEVYTVVIEDVPIPEPIRDLFAIDLRELADTHDVNLVEARLMPMIQTIRLKTSKCR